MRGTARNSGGHRAVAQWPVVGALVGLLALAASACSTTFGPATVVVRPGTRVPDRIVEDVTGEYEMMEGVDPKGDTLMLLVRAYW